MKCAVVQPSYLPWRGYFDLIRQSDVFVFYDDVQFDKQGWRNRNRVKTANGLTWLTVPVLSKGNVARSVPICEIEINNSTRWAAKHLHTLRQSYARAPHIDAYLPIIENALLRAPDLLADLTIGLTIELSAALGLDTTFVRSSEMALPSDRMERLIATISQVGADRYISGPSAAAYLDETAMEGAGIELEWASYDYAPYPQIHGPFEPAVSIVDLLFMCGPDAGRYLLPRQ